MSLRKPADRPQRLAILGATGSIGSSTLDIVRRHPERFRVIALSANRDAEGLLKLVEEFHPKVVCLADSAAAEAFRKYLGTRLHKEIFIVSGAAGLEELAQLSDVDTVVAGIVGVAGLPSVLAAARSGKRVLLANKEAMVCAGSLLVDTAVHSGATILPIDSEHNAIFQALGSQYRCFNRPEHVRRVLLTASGGPFREWPLDLIRSATVAQALKHPNWTMGKKITVDSATMANKGLEWIEAHWLFSLSPQEIQIVVHPESIVHSMVEFADASTIAQLGPPDMRTPIANALAWPDRIESGSSYLDWATVGSLRFEPPDPIRFPALRLAAGCLESGQAASNIFNAANEQAVDAFLEGRICFGQIQDGVEAVLDALEGRFPEPGSLDDVIQIDREARTMTNHWISMNEQS